MSEGSVFLEGHWNLILMGVSTSPPPSTFSANLSILAITSNAITNTDNYLDRFKRNGTRLLLQTMQNRHSQNEAQLKAKIRRK